MNRASICAVAALVLLLFSTAGVFGRTIPQSHASLDYAMDQIAATHKFKEVAISPDGKRVAWVEGLGIVLALVSK